MTARQPHRLQLVLEQAWTLENVQGHDTIRSMCTSIEKAGHKYVTT